MCGSEYVQLFIVYSPPVFSGVCVPQSLSLIYNVWKIVGYISNDDLYQILKLMIGENKNLKDKQLQQIVDRTTPTNF
jgi:hypothetical protein